MVHLKTNDRPYACEHCDKTFLSSSKLKQHCNIHSGARPYQCKYCVKNFTNFPNWLKHVRRLHKVDHKTGEKLESMPTFLNKTKGKSDHSPTNKGNIKNGTLCSDGDDHKYTESTLEIETTNRKDSFDSYIDGLLPLSTLDDLDRAESILMQQTLDMEEQEEIHIKKDASITNTLTTKTEILSVDESFETFVNNFMNPFLSEHQCETNVQKSNTTMENVSVDNSIEPVWQHQLHQINQREQMCSICEEFRSNMTTVMLPLPPIATMNRSKSNVL